MRFDRTGARVTFLERPCHPDHNGMRGASPFHACDENELVDLDEQEGRHGRHLRHLGPICSAGPPAFDARPLLIARNHMGKRVGPGGWWRRDARGSLGRRSTLTSVRYAQCDRTNICCDSGMLSPDALSLPRSSPQSARAVVLARPGCCCFFGGTYQTHAGMQAKLNK